MGNFIFDLQNQALSGLVVEAQKAPDDGSSTMNEIVRRFDGKAWSIARSLTDDLDLREDLANVARLAVVTAVRHHDGRPGFVSYACRYMEGAAKRELSGWIKPGTVMHTATAVSLDIDIELMMDTEPALATDDFVEATPWGEGVVADAVTRLQPRQQDLLVQRYVDDLELSTIGEISGTSESAVGQRLATCHRTLQRCFLAA